jgi:Concanavalin A-like lectin/glucanases superfamily
MRQMIPLQAVSNCQGASNIEMHCRKRSFLTYQGATMKNIFRFTRLGVIITSLLIPHSSRATIPTPPGGGTDMQLDSWAFSDTNWRSTAGYPPLRYTNLVNVTNGGDGNCVLLDTTNADPTYLFYNVVETSGFTNIICSNGSISLWFNPNWTSTNAGGSGSGDWANLISLGYAGTNGPWWAWYMSADGCTIYFSSQTNGGSSSNYLSAPVSFVSSNWYNLVLTYGPTNTAFYTNGVLVTNGTGVAYWPGSDVTFFAVGSDTNGFYQAGGMMDDLATYNYQAAPTFIADNFAMYSIFYFSGHPSMFTNAPPNPPTAPTPEWFTGTGFVDYVTNAASCVTNSSVWLTNVSAIYFTNGTSSITFTIAGGSNGVPYDVFGTTALVPPKATNAQWAWLGQGYQCGIYTITNLPFSTVFLILGTSQDTDGDGLTDAYEGLVSKTSSTNAYTFGGLPDAWVALNGLTGNANLANEDPDFDGLVNGQEYLYGSKPLTSEGMNIFVANPSPYNGLP